MVSKSGISSLNPYNKHPLLHESYTAYLFLPCSCCAFRAGEIEDFREEKAESRLVSMMGQWLLQIGKATEIPANGCKHESVIVSHSEHWKKNSFDRKHCDFSSFKVLCPPPEWCVPPKLSKWFEHFPLRSAYPRAKPPNYFLLTVFILHSSTSARPKAPRSAWYGM